MIEVYLVGDDEFRKEVMVEVQMVKMVAITFADRYLQRCSK